MTTEGINVRHKCRVWKFGRHWMSECPVCGTSRRHGKWETAVAHAIAHLEIA